MVIDGYKYCKGQDATVGIVENCKCAEYVYFKLKHLENFCILILEMENKI